MQSAETERRRDSGLLQALLLKEMSAHPAEETVYERRWGGTKRTHRKELHRQAAVGDPPPVCYNKTNPFIPLIGNKLLMHDAMIYLQDPAHPELPERAQPPSALRLLVQSPLFPDGGDVIRWLGQQVTGPGTGRHKLRVRFQKKKKKGKKDQIFVWVTRLKESSPYLRLQRAQPVAHGCDSTAVETTWEESTKKTENPSAVEH